MQEGMKPTTTCLLLRPYDDVFVFVFSSHDDFFFPFLTIAKDTASVQFSDTVIYSVSDTLV